LAQQGAAVDLVVGRDGALFQVLACVVAHEFDFGAVGLF